MVSGHLGVRGANVRRDADEGIVLEPDHAPILLHAMVVENVLATICIVATVTLERIVLLTRKMSIPIPSHNGVHGVIGQFVGTIANNTDSVGAEVAADLN